jgi:hypothetical protein
MLTIESWFMFESSDYIIFVCFGGLIACLLIAKIFSYKKLLDEKNIQIIQFYLDGKFLYKNLVSSVSSCSASEYCSQLMKSIKEYYNLEDVIVIDSIIMISGENNTFLRSEIIKYIQKNIAKISAAIDGHKLARFSCQIKDSSYVMYIASIASRDEGDGLIVCVEQSPSLLTKQEKNSLENSVNLLKTRLLYG